MAFTKQANGITVYRDSAGYLTLRDGDDHEFGVPAEFDSTWEKFSVVIRKESLLHMLNEGHTKLDFIDGLSPFVASGGIGQYIAMPMCIRKPQAEAEQTTEQATVQTEQTAVQPAPESAEQKTTSNTNIPTSTKEQIPMIDTNTITHVVSAPVQMFTPNQESAKELNPLDELTANIEAMKAKLKAMYDESAVMSRKVREVAIAQRQKEREYVQTKRTIERIRTASGF